MILLHFGQNRLCSLKRCTKACRMTSRSQRSWNMPTIPKSISVEESLSYLVSLSITFATICERCKKYDGHISSNAMWKLFHSYRLWLAISKNWSLPPLSGMGMRVLPRWSTGILQREISADSSGCPKITLATIWVWHTVRLTSIYYRVSGYQNFCFAPTETIDGRVKKITCPNCGMVWWSILAEIYLVVDYLGLIHVFK